MNVKRSLCCALASLATAAALAPAQLTAADSANTIAKTAAIRPPATRVADVSLADGGLLVGQVFDSALQPVSGATVTVLTGGSMLASTTTDEHGTFAVTGLRGGVHQISTGDSLETCRLWAAGTAPPAAQATVRIVPGQETVVRGQSAGQQPYTPGGMNSWTRNPWIVGGIVGAAVGGPILLHNLDEDDDSGS